MKNTVRAMGIAIILLLLVQIVVMFLPYFSFPGEVKPTRKDPDPQTEFSLQDYCWMHTEDMGKNFFQKRIENYNVNDHAVSLVLTFVFACVCVVLNTMKFSNSFNKFVTFRAGLINVVAHAISCFWGYVAINAYLTSGVLQFGDQNLYMISLITIFVTTGLIALRLVLEIVSGIIDGNKARAARRAAREAA